MSSGITEGNTAPGEFRRGWKVLLAASVGIALGSTVLPFNMLGAVIIPLENAYGWTRGSIELGYLLFTFVSAAMYLPVGSLVDKYGGRRVALVGLPLFAAGFAAISLSAGSIALFHVGWVLLGLLGAAIAPVTFTRILNDWFSIHRGAALGIALVLGGLATAGQQLLSTWLAETFGWQSVFIIGALLPVLISLPVAWAFLHPASAARTAASPVELGEKTGRTLAEVLRHHSFWVIATAIMAATFGIGGIVLNLKPLLAGKGFSPADAANVAVALSLSVTVSRLVTGFLLDRIWAPLVAMPMFLLPILSCIWLSQEHIDGTMAIMAAVLIGVGAGAEADLIAFLAVRYFGLAHYGRIYGLLFGMFIAVSGLAPFAFGLIHDLHGSYGEALTVSAVLFGIAGFLPLLLGRYPRFETASPNTTSQEPRT